jgi:hypothetical protein
MKRFTGVLVAACIVGLVAVGCGSSDGTNTGGGGTPSATPAATSAKTMYAMFNANSWMYSSTLPLAGAIQQAGAMVKEVETDMISCTGVPSGFECVIWDSQGSATSSDHKCDVTGTWTQNTSEFDIAYDCYTYIPGDNAIVDGNWTASITVNSYAMSSEVPADDVKAVYKDDAASECDIDDIADVCGTTFTSGDGFCSVDCDDEALCTAANALVIIQWTAGSRGVTMTDECGTYVIASGSTHDVAACMLSDTEFVMTFIMNGTINGDVIDETIDLDCEYNG